MYKLHFDNFLINEHDDDDNNALMLMIRPIKNEIINNSLDYIMLLCFIRLHAYGRQEISTLIS